MRVVVISFIILFSITLTICSGKSQETKMDPPHSMEGQKERSNIIDLKEIMSECNETFRVEQSYLDALNTSGSFPDETDKTPKCYIRCVLEKSEAASGDGEFDAERTADLMLEMHSMTPRNTLKDMAETCSNRSESCKCEKSYQYIKCLMETKIKMTEKEDGS